MVDEAYEALLTRIAKRREESLIKLASPDPAVRKAEEDRIVEAGVKFIMDTSIGGP